MLNNEMYANFRAWRVCVEMWVTYHTGLYLDELPDCPYRAWYDNDMPPRYAAKLALDNAGRPETLEVRELT